MILTPEQEARQILTNRGWFPSAGSVPFDVALSVATTAYTAGRRAGREEVLAALPDEIDLFRTIRDARARGYAQSARAAYSRIKPLEAAIRNLSEQESGR